jgi:hypothetical protein
VPALVNIGAELRRGRGQRAESMGRQVRDGSAGPIIADAIQSV